MQYLGPLDLLSRPSRIAFIFPKYSLPAQMRQSAYQLDGAPVYQGKDETGHIWWDIGCDCKDCKQDRFYATDDDEKKVVYPISSQQALQQRYEAGDPEVGLLGEPSGSILLSWTEWLDSLG